MMLRNTAILVVFAAATLWGQSSAGPLATRRQPVVANSNADAIAAANRAKAASNQHLQDLGTSLTKMHALLKQMRANSSSKDPIAKANLDMWGLMLDQLDKQYEQLHLAARAREDFEARRAAMYKQADDKAAAEAKKAQEAAKAAADSNATSQPSTAPVAQPTGATPQAPTTSPN